MKYSTYLKAVKAYIIKEQKKEIKDYGYCNESFICNRLSDVNKSLALRYKGNFLPKDIEDHAIRLWQTLGNLDTSSSVPFTHLMYAVKEFDYSAQSDEMQDALANAARLGFLNGLIEIESRKENTERKGN